jgi:hypothetical protein
VLAAAAAIEQARSLGVLLFDGSRAEAKADHAAADSRKSSAAGANA